MSLNILALIAIEHGNLCWNFCYLKLKDREELQDGGRVRCGDLTFLLTNTSEIHLHVEQPLQNTY